MSDILNERKIRNSEAFVNLLDAYENTLQMKTDLMHSRIAAGLNHGLAISFQNHYAISSDGNKRNSNKYVAPTLVGTGSNQYGQLGYLIDQTYRQNVDEVECFEKIFLIHNQEEYYPIQVCCGYSFSLILAIEGRHLQWLKKLTSEAEKMDKTESQAQKQEQMRDLLSRTRVFFSGKLGAHHEDEPERRGEKKATFLRGATRQKTKIEIRNSLRIDVGNNKNSTLNIPTINYSENEQLIGENDYSELYSQQSDEDKDDRQISDRVQIIAEEQKSYKFTIADVVAIPLPKGITQREGFVIQISCGTNFCLALTYNFRVYAWGDNSYGNLGTGDYDFGHSPKMIEFEVNKGNDSKIQYICCGSNHSAAVSVSGKLYTWGQGTFGQLGHKNTIGQNLPVQIKDQLEEKKIVLVACGGSHTVCLTNEGYAYSWVKNQNNIQIIFFIGNNRNGQLGLGDQEQRHEPQKLLRLQNYFIMNVVCGTNTTFIFSQVGKIFAFGSNQHNKLGLQQNFAAKDNYLIPVELETNFVKGADKQKLKDVYIYQMASSCHFTYALSNKGLLTTWGLQVNGCLSRKVTSYISEKMNNYDKNQTNMLIPCSSLSKTSQHHHAQTQKFFFPIQNMNIFKASEKDFISNEIVDIQLGTFHTMALTNAGEIYIWGSNQMGQHGVLSTQIRTDYEDMNVKRMQLQNNEISPETLPSVVSFFNIKENRRITYIAAGSEYCMAIENKRLVYAWGRNNDGQLGIGKTQLYVDSPQIVLGLEGNLMKSIACGENHTLFLTDVGRVFSCGSPKDGKLGLGKRTNTQIQPQLIEGLTKVEQIVCGQSHSMALAQDTFFQDDDDEFSRSTNSKMVIFTWGNAWESKLGHGDRENLSEPTKIQSNYLFRYISAGNHHSAALTVDDNLVVWGPYKYFGHTKPDENTKNKKVVEKQNEYHEFQKPTLHPKITDKVRYVCLGDKTTFVVAKKDNKISQYGMFESDIREQKKLGFSIEHILDKILPYKGGGSEDSCEVPVNEINKIVTSKDHVAILGKNQIYTWGHDSYTGRLGHGYVFQDNQNSIDNMQPEEQNELDFRQKQSFDFTKKVEKPEYCNYINKYLQELLKAFMQLFNYKLKNPIYFIDIKSKKQQQGQEEDGQLSSDYDSEESGEDEKSVEGDTERHQRTKKKQGSNKNSPLPKDSHHNTVTNVHRRSIKRDGNFKQTVISTVSGAPQNFASSSNIFPHKNKHQRKSTHRKLTIQAKLPSEKVNNQDLLIQFFENPATTKSTYEKLMAKDKPDLYTFLVEPYGLLNEERILFVYDKVSSIQGKIFIQYKNAQDFLNNNKIFKKAAQSEILKRMANQPFNIKYTEKSSNVLKHQEHLLPFLNNKFYYIKIFTLLQLHPCYLLKIYEKKIDKDNFIQLVKETFGDLENNIRKQRIYVEICKKILMIDLKDNKFFKDQRKPIIFNTDKNTSYSYVFVKLFLHFYESLSENIKLNRQFRLRMKKSFEEIVNSAKYPQLDSMFVFERSGLNSTYIKTDEQNKEQIDKNQIAITDYLLTFFKDTDFLSCQSSSGTARSVLCEKIRELIQFFYDFISTKRPSEITENIQNCILSIIFSSMLENCQVLCNSGDKLAGNYEWIIKFIKMYINLDENDKKNQDINNLIEFIKSKDEERNKIYKRLIGKAIPKKSTAQFEQIQDIYVHSLEYQDDKIMISLGTLEKITKFLYKANIKFNPKEEEDFFLQCCKKLVDEEPNLVSTTVDKQHEHQKVKIKLETRQLFYSSTQVLKKCSDCETFLQKDFLRSIDKDIKEQFLMFNPSSLESCGIKMFQIINKLSFEEFISGKTSIQQLSSKYIVKFSKDKFVPQNVQIVKNFSKSFENAYELEYSNQSQSDKLIIPSDLSKQVLLSLKSSLDKQINLVVKYYNKMETLYRVYHAIKQNLKSFLSNINNSKAVQFRVITNCYYGIANRDVERVIERDPMAITSKISGSIHGKNLSTYLYENIDVFSDKDLTTIRQKYQNNQINEHFIKLNMFGEYSLNSLKQKDVIKDIDDTIVSVLEMYIPKNKLANKKNLKKDVERCLFYIFNDFGDKYVSVDVVYKGAEFSIFTMLCGLKGSKELRIDSFRIEKEVILAMRKQRTREDISKQTEQFGFTTFLKKGLLKIIEKMEDHYSVYEYIYSSNNCTN